jgi:hypothetical protein
MNRPAIQRVTSKVERVEVEKGESVDGVRNKLLKLLTDCPGLVLKCSCEMPHAPVPVEDQGFLSYR